ncbi:MAG: poly-beta-hydroxybutyrate polymerase N-terminal domain-containing protein [Gammaproteobacteria bacterium]|uniref:PHA/PHB synthase family protein n=1 Tax=Rhodoferax sp. TaxID=50421 RepID=UPI0017AF0E24|nr:poly-beta-hydroxybutyrate polymerase N-terminal domain-containing protein [Rhodoferax sp.]MBU3900019.1 poly-beta-hydroxybutyrate polymerase N-terminal domain-containing protein [Gammaproteobacteria bacterium]MBA3059330.1 poly-beta-hydroxybutyrate polymerase-like protein [Rhodoferax sp.]MBU3999383.1 poly-beta-hydroxybutyrate polymerase N-terminal domain-containing protein [Gammaproteobacteria bacterium]MBU4082057.1 poly-beta-hydroxybutyrate polymerase N-terminal domain-containing protein [Gam
MKKSISLGPPPQEPLAASRSLDEAFHAQLAKLNLGLPPISLGLAYADWAMHLAISPGQQMILAQRALALSQHALRCALQQPLATGEEAPPEPTADPRFTDPGWQQWPFNVFEASFKASNTWWHEAAQIEGVSSHHRHLLDFYTRQGLDALSPSNWPLSNPEVLKKGRQSWGQSWLKGYQHLALDLLERQQQKNLGASAKRKALPFKVGQDVAVTPGKVVFRNALIELIKYTPTTAAVYPEPLLIVPSCIMKYYILDLSPANSMVRYLVAQGHTVFMISWRNPDAADRELGMQDYLQLGVMQAMAAVKSLTDAPRIHSLGYCLGGTFLAIVAAALGARQPLSQRRGQDKDQYRRREDALAFDALPELASVTLLAASTDFSEPGELGVFIDDAQLKTLRASMARTGYFSGRQMAESFQFLNSRDLIWSRSTRRYLLGQDEVGNDMMSWNMDVTRLPERMHNEYLSSLFLNNALATGNYRVAGVGVALMDIRAPLLVVGTVRDHVSPWQSVYKIHRLTDTQTTFILAAGGHNAGIVSEPGHAGRSYQIDSVEQGHAWVDPDTWAAQAPVVEGSWWEAMHQWLRERSGKPVPAPVIDVKTVLGDAPGDYVMVRYAD